MARAKRPESILTPTPLPTPIVPEKPVYVVEQGTVVNALKFTGRVSPVQEQALFFKSDGFVDQIFVQRGDMVAAGDVLAQLEITDLQNQLAQANVALETAELRLTQAEQERQDVLAEAAINREKIALQLQQGQVNSNSATLVSAQIELENAQQRLAAAEYELQKSRDRDWEPEELRRQYEQGGRICSGSAGGGSSPLQRCPGRQQQWRCGSPNLGARAGPGRPASGTAGTGH
ncbi:MAG: efflux RND transporter periplasmic adaptor subunit [Chloroflexi bacterium]|nr:efflux RND transporter periplasmic adaptor subunit [Chloroflexota bacterium]